jgi:tape measure domain-containing protein
MAQTLEILIKGKDEASHVFKNVEKNAGGLQNTLGKIGGTMGVALAAGVAAAGVGVVALGGLAINTGFDFLKMKENAMTAFSTILGDTEKAKSLLADLQDFAKVTPFQFEEVANAAKSLLAFGTEAADMEETLRRVGDIASGVGAPLNEIAQIYGKAQVQGRLFAEDINQLTGRGIPLIQELAKQFGVTEEEVKKLVEEGKVGFDNLEQAFKDLTTEGGKFGGMMEAQSKTFDGMWSTFIDQLTEVSALLAGPLFDVAKEALSGISEMLASPEVQEGIKRFATDLADGMRAAGEAIKGLMPFVTEVVGAISSLFQGGGGAENGFMTWLGELGAALNEAGATIGTALKPALDALAPILNEIGGVVGPVLAEGFRLMGEHLNNSVIPGIALSIVKFLEAIPPAVEFAKTVKDVIVDALIILGNKWDEINTFISDTAGFIQGAIDKFVEIVSILEDKVAPAFEWFKNNVLKPFTDALAALKNYISQVIDALTTLATKIAGGLPSLPSLPSAADVGGALNNAAGGIFGGGRGAGGAGNIANDNRSQNNNVTMILPNVRTANDAQQIQKALNNMARGANMRVAQGLG